MTAPAGVARARLPRVPREPAVLAALLATTLLALIPGLTLPIVVRVYVDRVLVAGEDGWQQPLLLLLALLIVIALLVTWLQLRLLARHAVRTATADAAGLAWHVLRLPAPVVDGEGASGLAARGAATQTLAVSAGIFLTRALAINVTGLTVFALAAFLVDARLALAGIAVVALSMATTVRLLRGREAAQRAADDARVDQLTTLTGIVRAIETVKATAAEGWVFARWGRVRDRRAAAITALGTDSQRLAIVPAVTIAAGLTLILGLGSFLVLAGELTLGGLVGAQTFLIQMLVPAGQLVWLGVLLASVRSADAMTAEIRALPLDPEAEGPAVVQVAPDPAIPWRPAALALRGLRFGYAPDGPPLLDGLELDVPAGARVALVGASGSGKSTIIRIAIGELRPWAGTVTIDGVPRLAMPRADRVAALAYVPQAPLLVPGTIRENLTLFDETIPESAIVRALRDARIEAAVDARPLGLDEPVGPGAGGFSGGELQRLAIARAIVREPRILVLDEATSALDPIVEAEVEERLRARGATTLVVAHRLSTIRDADRIVVIDRGRIVQSGTYAELRDVGRFRELIHG